jgi:raffinose/stachyose/melibiose transport system permease protein
MYPIVMVLLNSFKVETAISTSTAFQFPTAETWAGLANYATPSPPRAFCAAWD